MQSAAARLAVASRGTLARRWPCYAQARGCSIEASELPLSLRVHATRVRRAVQDARDATAIAAMVDSDDLERNDSVGKGEVAVKAYARLLEQAGAEHKAAVEKQLGADVDAMKRELFMSRRQRVWMGWRGWF